MSRENQAKILSTIENRTEMPHFSKLATMEQIAANDFTLSVSNYVEQEDTSEKVDITELNAEIAEIVTSQSQLRTEIDAIVAEIEGGK